MLSVPGRWGQWEGEGDGQGGSDGGSTSDPFLCPPFPLGLSVPDLGGMGVNTNSRPGKYKFKTSRSSSAADKQ